MPAPPRRRSSPEIVAMLRCTTCRKYLGFGLLKAKGPNFAGRTLSYMWNVPYRDRLTWATGPDGSNAPVDTRKQCTFPGDKKTEWMCEECALRYLAEHP